ncbi:CoA ester lyase [Paucibacter sp. R3-3]|uniref:CoA ester lyase n=1 Tax=Roseateles agri TaxID=3098619 RepID=A0ABU5DDF3_9BURK|nr:CoA ester lyase [Paucibacter sp. R3-3]MDY0744159.1 CoA ester lyase [Paucibacter sp. R3-3]
MRSKLFVPGARPELFAKALASDADAISIDLEDAVPDDRKAEARDAVRAFLASEAALRSGKQLIVRVNALGSPHFEADLRAVACASLSLVNLPKIESAADVQRAAAVLAHAQTLGRCEGSDIRLLANIETPRALRAAHEIAAAHPKLWGLQLGLGDLFEPHGIDRRTPANVHAAMFAVAMAAAEAGVACCDGAFPDLQDEAGLRAEAQMSRALGFVGKSCIHPRQVAVCNEAFRPDAEKLAQARRIVDAAAQATAQGRGAFVVDGKMIDAPFLARARRLLAIHDEKKK